jgi:hypothetical protein
VDLDGDAVSPTGSNEDAILFGLAGLLGMPEFN